MKKRCKTFLLLVLPVMLLFNTLTAIPVTGAEAEYTSWDGLQKAISESDKTEFTLTQDIIAPGSLTTPLQIRDKNVVLDLNGYTLSRNRSSAHGTGQVIVVHKGAIINTPSIKPHVLLRKINWGPRAITLHEDGTFENRVLMACELAQKEGSQLVPVGAVSGVEIFIVKIWKILVDISIPFWSSVTGLIYGL